MFGSPDHQITRFFYGHIICAVPDTVMVIEFICEIDMFGSVGAVA